MIVAVGVFSKPCFPLIEGKDSFKGEIVHSSSYRSPGRIKGNNIIVVGGAFSGAEIASDICINSDKKVTNIITNPL